MKKIITAVLSASLIFGSFSVFAENIDDKKYQTVLKEHIKAHTSLAKKQEKLLEDCANE